MYSAKVMDHFHNPRNVGEMDNPDGTGHVGNPVCGDIMEIYIKVKDNIITDVKFKIRLRGCHCYQFDGIGNGKRQKPGRSFKNF